MNKSNATGGKNSRKQAKRMSAPSDLLLATDPELHRYAQCTRIVGGDCFHAMTSDKMDVRVRFSGKCKGKGRKHNNVTANCFVLIELFDFQSESAKIRWGELVKVYSDADVERLHSRRLLDAFKVAGSASRGEGTHIDDWEFDRGASEAQEPSSQRASVGPGADDERKMPADADIDFSDI
jgi:translation initiation factor IF-1